MTHTINSALDWWAHIAPAEVALSVSGDRLTFREYRDWSARIAAHLESIGVQAGDRVAICGPNSLEYCALIVGSWGAGAISVALSTRHTASELSIQCEEFTPAVVFASNDYISRFNGLPVRVRPLEEIAALRVGPQITRTLTLDADSPIAIISTSGSSARPKGVVHSHRTLMAYAVACALEEPGHSRGARVLAAAPMSTSAGIVKLSQYAVVGATLYFEPAFEPERFLGLLVSEKITTYGGVPIFFERMSQCPGFAEADLSNLRLATVGGAPVHRPLIETWLKKGIVIRQLYGQTEVVGAATLMPEHLAVKYPEKCGRGGIFADIATINAHGERCRAGEPGEIIVRGPSVMVGYWNNPAATAEVKGADGWLRTGDMGVIDDDGYLTFVARLKDIIISGGLNISAAEIESVIGAIDCIDEVAVFGVPDEKFGETPMAVIYTREDVAFDEIIERCNANLADYKVPRYIAAETEPFPRSQTGKILKAPLREKYQNAPSALPRLR